MAINMLNFFLSYDVGLAQLVSRAGLKPGVMGSIPAWSTFVKRFCFSAEKNYVVITTNYDENKLRRNS
jgi:hypothetical protein